MNASFVCVVRISALTLVIGRFSRHFRLCCWTC